MWIHVKTMDGKRSERINKLSKLTKIENLKERLIETFDVPAERIRLYYQGKQLVDDHTLFDYNVGLNDTIQLFVKPMFEEIGQQSQQSDENNKNIESKSNASSEDEKEVADSATVFVSQYFQVGDRVDAKDSVHGAWFEAQITDLKQDADSSQSICSMKKHDGLLYFVTYEGFPEEELVGLPLHLVRPRAKLSLEFDDIQLGDIVMVNYNPEDPGNPGFWFDCKITGKRSQKRKGNILIGTIYIGSDGATLENCSIKMENKVFAIENTIPISDRKIADNATVATTLRSTIPNCLYCQDNPDKKCKHCSCCVCGGKDEPAKQLLCDECNSAYHLWCLNPQLSDIPDSDEWYCVDCKNDENEVIKPGQKLQLSKKKLRMASSTSKCSRDWGKGMACVGRTKVCTIVPPNHFGPVPGVEVGMLWKYRIQVSEIGGHRPHVSGIHGREHEGAYSLVSSGGYEDDVDEGDQFMYTGSGGRDLSGNKRTAEQSCDQTLTKTNKALAMNCSARFNDTEGAEAKDWKQGKPVRVFRSSNGKKHSDYGPEEGIRYDGIYKVVKYWPEKGISGFIVWKYLLRRDDAIPAPYTAIGKKRIKKLGFILQYPDSDKKAEGSSNSEEKTLKKGKKRSFSGSEDRSSKQKRKVIQHSLDAEKEKLIFTDVKNEKHWIECKNVFIEKGHLEFLKKIESDFMCVCCQDLVFQPVTTPCLHNICKSCLQRSFKAGVYTCPMCRSDLGKTFPMTINEALLNILETFFPGYTAGR